ncbi:MAG: DUF309 domain-containing protein [Armatimonadota bacterium]
MFRLPQQFHEAVHRFNEGEYFECHEVLEELWRAEPTSLRLFYQGVLQIAVGCYHLCVRRNRRGAISKLRAGLEKLQQFPTVIDSVDVHDLRQQAEALLARLEATGEEEIAQWSDARPLAIRYLV